MYSNVRIDCWKVCIVEWSSLWNETLKSDTNIIKFLIEWQLYIHTTDTLQTKQHFKGSEILN